MTQEQFDALVIGDVLIRRTNGKRYIVTRTNRGITPGCNAVWAQVVGPDGQPWQRLWNVTLDGYDVAEPPKPEHPTDSLCWGTKIFGEEFREPQPAPEAPADRYVVEKNGPREYEKEGRNGRIYTGMVTTWDVVDIKQCTLVSEHWTRREAKAALARLLAAGAGR